MIIHHLGEKPSILNRFIAELRDVNIQTDRMRFRKNLERIGEVLCYEMSKYLHYQPELITTPLGEKSVELPKDQIVICSILRAGLALHQGLMNFFDGADNAFISAYRKLTSETDFNGRVFGLPIIRGENSFLSRPYAGHRAFIRQCLQCFDSLR